MLRLFNSLTRKVEDFKPINPPQVGIYTCGPTVYDYTHIGHLRKYTGDDLLKNVLRANSLQVRHVMNITDVGHLTSDADEGDDKLEEGARERGMTAWEVAKFFEEYFFKSTDLVNIERPEVVARATEHIGEQVKLIEKLEKGGFTYQTEQAIYFDISKFPDYSKLSGQKLEEKVVGSRSEVIVDQDKKHPQDFALWFFTVGHFKDHTMKWSSPWGQGFPGWHIECSAMSMEYLSNSFDIHTGGVDHIPVHHTNEIAQSEAATGKQFVRFWIHYEFLIVKDKKMSKSQKNFYTIDDVLERGIDPLALRYLYLTAHYRDKLNFTWESLEAAQNALNNLRVTIRSWPKPDVTKPTGKFFQRFMGLINDDLDFPQVLALLWKMVKSAVPLEEKSRDLLEMDKILGLKLDEYLGTPLEIPEAVQKLVQHREHARKAGDFQKADQLRKEIGKLGFIAEDTPEGSRIKQK